MITPNRFAQKVGELIPGVWGWPTKVKYFCRETGVLLWETSYQDRETVNTWNEDILMMFPERAVLAKVTPHRSSPTWYWFDRGGVVVGPKLKVGKEAA